MSLILALLLQVGPNPNAMPAGAEEEIINRRLTNPTPRSNVADEITNPTSVWLSECLDQLDQDAARAHTKAQIRRNETSGADRVLANHCLGLASTELGRWDDARAAFLAAREETPEDELSTRSRFSLMAGNAAMVGGDLMKATELFGMARSEAQMASSATLEALASTDLARVLVAAEQPNEALEMLDTATRLEPRKSEAWLLKATLLRRLGRLDEAQTAIDQAVGIAPLDAQVGLEAGVIAILSDNRGEARKRWQTVLDTQPDSLAAQTAKDYIAQLGPEPAETPATASTPAPAPADSVDEPQEETAEP